MTVMVAFQWAASSKDATAAPDGTVSWTGARLGISAEDRVAIEMARQYSQSQGEILVGVTVCSDSAAESRACNTALACGVDRVIMVVVPQELTSAMVADAIGAIACDLDDVKMVVLGSCSIDAGDRLVGPLLGGLLGWPVITEVRELESESKMLRIIEDSRGAPHHVTVEPPVIVQTALDAAQPRQLTLREILGANKKPSEQIPIEALHIGVPPRVEMLGREPLPAARRAGQVISGDNPQAIAQEIVRQLVQWGEA